jgi:hypothetical protein
MLFLNLFELKSLASGWVVKCFFLFVVTSKALTFVLSIGRAWHLWEFNLLYDLIVVDTRISELSSLETSFLYSRRKFSWNHLATLLSLLLLHLLHVENNHFIHLSPRMCLIFCFHNVWKVDQGLSTLLSQSLFFSNKNHPHRLKNAPDNQKNFFAYFFKLENSAWSRQRHQNEKNDASWYNDSIENVPETFSEESLNSNELNSANEVS